jgi:hypothetical protein
LQCSRIGSAGAPIDDKSIYDVDEFCDDDTESIESSTTAPVDSARDSGFPGMRCVADGLKGNTTKDFDALKTDERSLEGTVRLKVSHLCKFFGSSRIAHCAGVRFRRDQAVKGDRAFCAEERTTSADDIETRDEFVVDWRAQSSFGSIADPSFVDESIDYAALELEFEELDFDIELALLGVQSSNQ